MGYSSDFNDGVTYNTGDINAIRAGLATAGVVNEADTSMSVVDNGGGTVKVLEGQAIFSDGSRIVIDSSGEVLTVIGAGKNYVFVKRGINTVSVEISTDEPTGDYVLLAEVTGSTIVDKRQYSSFKVMRGLGNGYFVKKNISVAYSLTSEWAKIHEEEVETTLFKLATINSVDYKTEILETYHEVWAGTFDFEEEALYGFFKKKTNVGEICFVGTSIANGFVVSYPTNAFHYIKLIYNGTKIEVWGRKSGSGTGVGTLNFDLTLA